MSYRDAVQHKLSPAGERNFERMQLWAEIADEFDTSGSAGVEARLKKKADDIYRRFRLELKNLDGKL